MAGKRKLVLTDTQFQFLTNLLQGPQTAVEYYSPANKLFNLGFATRVMGSFTYTYTVTDAGRAHHQTVYMADKVCHTCKTAPWVCRVCTRKTCEHYCTNKKNDKTAVCGRCTRTR